MWSLIASSEASVSLDAAEHPLVFTTADQPEVQRHVFCEMDASTSEHCTNSEKRYKGQSLSFARYMNLSIIFPQSNLCSYLRHPSSQTAAAVCHIVANMRKPTAYIRFFNKR